MIDSHFRTPYQRLVIDPLLKRRVLSSLSPTGVTLVGFLVGITIPFFLYFHLIWGAFTALILSGFCDTLDGSLARDRSLASPKGAALDIIADRGVEFAILLGLYLYAPEARGLAVIWILGSIYLCVTTFLTLGILEKNTSEKSFYYSPGLIERAEAFIFFGLMILVPSLFISLTILFVLLTILTSIIRIKSYY